MEPHEQEQPAVTASQLDLLLEIMACEKDEKQITAFELAARGLTHLQVAMLAYI